MHGLIARRCCFIVFLAPDGAKARSLGREPKEELRNSTQSPERATADSSIDFAIAPFGASATLLNKPMVHAIGYVLRPRSGPIANAYNQLQQMVSTIGIRGFVTRAAAVCSAPVVHWIARGSMSSASAVSSSAHTVPGGAPVACARGLIGLVGISPNRQGE